MSSFRSRRLRENRQYHRTQVTIMTGSNWRFRNRGGRQDLMLSTYQISSCNTSPKGEDGGPFISEQSNHYWRGLHAGWHSAVAGPLFRLPSAQDYGYGERKPLRPKSRTLVR